ncbi:transposase [Nostoc flagelliforme]
MSRKPYPSDLTDSEWEKIAPLLPTSNESNWSALL